MDPRTRDLLAAIVLGAQVFLTELDFESVGLVTAGPDLIKWAVLAPLLFLPIFVLPVFSNSLPRVLTKAPHGWMTLWLIWSLTTLLWSFAPRQTVLQGGAIVGLWVYAAWFVGTYGFAKFARVVMIATSMFLGIGLLRDLATANFALDGSKRFFGISFAATNLARLSLITLMLSLSTARDPRYRTLGLGCGTLAVIVLIGTNTRTTILAILMIAAYMGGRRLGWRVGTLGMLLVASLTFSVINGAGSTDALSRGGTSSDVASFNGRTTIWDISLDLFQEKQLFGYGTASSENIWIEAAKDGQISWYAANAHNIMLELLLSHGLVGLSLFVMGLVSFARRSRLEPDPWHDAIVIAILTTGLTEAIVNRPSTVFAVLGAVFAARSLASGRWEEPVSASGDPITAITSVSSPNV